MQTAKLTGIIAAGLQIAAAQTGAANRMEPGATPQPGSGFVVKTLRMFQPDDDTPLTAKARLRAYLMDSIGPARLISEAASAGVEQGIHSPKEWRLGAAGFAERFGDNLAYNGVRTSLTYATSILFHEDNRYFASGKKTFWGRLGHALISPAMARRNDGSDTVSISSLTGIVGASTISRAWVPPSWQGGTNIGRSIAYTYLGMAGMDLVREFVPDLIQRMGR